MNDINFHFSTPNDRAEWLPPPAADKLRALRQRVTDTRALLPSSEILREAHATKAEHEARISELTRAAGLGGKSLAEDHPSVADAKRKLDKAVAELARLKAIDAARAAKWQSAGHLLRQVEAWLRDGCPAGTSLAAFEGAEPQLLGGETLADGIERLRRRARELAADLHAVRSAPYPCATAKAAMRKQIAALAERGAPDCSAAIEHGAEIGWPRSTERLSIISAETVHGFATGELPDALALTVWLHKDALIKKLDAAIDAEADDAAALGDEQRKEREAELLADTLATEREEAALIWKGQADGLDVEHRLKCSPLAVLGLQFVASQVRSPSATSPQHAITISGQR